MKIFLHWVKVIDSINEWIGRVTAWLVLVMVLLISYDVAMRYLFHSGSVALQELEWHVFAIIFLFGAAYTLKHDGHVRVDILYRSRFMSARRRAWVDLVGTLVFLIPFCLLVISGSLPFVGNSFAMSEGSPDPGGLPYRYLLKAAIPLAFGLLLMQGLSLLVTSISIIRGGESLAGNSSPDGD